MKSKYFFGGLFVLIGVLWIVGATHFLITDVFPVQLQDPWLGHNRFIFRLAP